MFLYITGKFMIPNLNYELYLERTIFSFVQLNEISSPGPKKW
jgi:hypothetical protein